MGHVDLQKEKEKQKYIHKYMTIGTLEIHITNSIFPPTLREPTNISVTVSPSITLCLQLRGNNGLHVERTTV